MLPQVRCVYVATLYASPPASDSVLPVVPVDKEDIIDETLNTFRANVLFRNFDVRTSSDRTLIYLTLYTHQCLVKLEKIEDKATGRLNIRLVIICVINVSRNSSSRIACSCN